MSIEKLDLQSPDLVNANFERLAALFPNCVTETAEGKAIDFDLLKQELSHAVVEGNKERYRLEWPGKKEAIVTANLPTTKTLRPVREDSVDFDNTENLYIEGDNLEVLKLLQESYLGKIKMIYIDPPYNTGKDFVYKDNFTVNSEEWKEKSGDYDEYKQRLVANPETSGRYHSDWLSMMYPRLKLARNLLTDDGVIFISIDDNEVHNLRKICDEIFGEGNFVSELIWKSGGTSSAHFTIEHEYIIVYSKSINKLQYFEYKGDESISDRAIKKPSAKNPVSSITFPAGIDFECEDKIFPSEFGDKEPVRIIKGIFECKNRKLANEVTIEAAWTMSDMIKNWLKGETVIDQKGQIVKRFFFKSNGILQYEKEKGTIHPKSIVTEFTTKQGSNTINTLFGDSYFDFPKPNELIQNLVSLVTNSNDIILDFFSGSATTAHAVMQLNAEDGGNRKYIMVQLPEATDEKSEAYKAGYKNICEIGKERIRRAAKKIKEETGADMDYGFRVYRLDESNMQDVYYRPQDYKQETLDLFADNVKPDRTPDDLLAQVMLDWGLPLSLKIEQAQIAGKQVFKVAGDSLYACFDKGIDEAFAKAIAQDKPLRIVFRDSGFKDDTAKTNVKQLLKQLSPETEMKVI
jgi:adenine-specific DNA-methyltransferase